MTEEQVFHYEHNEAIIATTKDSVAIALAGFSML
jgi:hypothetical protein